MDTVAIWTKKLCANFIQGGTSSTNDNNNCEGDDKDFFNYPILDLGTGNGLLLQALAKQGYYTMSNFLMFCCLYTLLYSKGILTNYASSTIITWKNNVIMLRRYSLLLLISRMSS
jgi:2-polyprenyl-3-methyl-5-hydroxy-6-metoxy-1,4-benzoquinol methylase